MILSTSRMSPSRWCLGPARTPRIVLLYIAFLHPSPDGRDLSNCTCVAMGDLPRPSPRRRARGAGKLGGYLRTRLSARSTHRPQAKRPSVGKREHDATPSRRSPVLRPPCRMHVHRLASIQLLSDFFWRSAQDPPPGCEPVPTSDATAHGNASFSG